MTETVEKEIDMSGPNPFGDASAEDILALDAKLDQAERTLSDTLPKEDGDQGADDSGLDDVPLSSRELKKPEAPKEKPGNQNASETSKQEPVKTAATKAPEGPKTEEKVKSPYEKAKEREAKAWQKIDADKAEIAREKAEIAKQRQELEAARKQVVQAPAPAVEVDVMNDPVKLEQAAAKYEAEGKFELADLARERAAEVRKNPPVSKAPEAKASTAVGKSYFEMQPHEVTLSGMPKGEVSRLQNEMYAQGMKEMPEVLKQGTELNQKFLALAQQNLEAFHFPRGPYMLAKMVKLEADASRLPGLTQEVQTKTTEIENLNKRVKELEALVAPGGGGPVDLNQTDRAFEDLPLDEMQREVRTMVRRAS